MGFIKQINNLLFKQINPTSLSIFRIAFGLFAILEVFHFYRTHYIEDYLLNPQYNFNYDFLPLSTMGSLGMNILLFILLVCSVLILIGKYYRIAISVFFVFFSFFFLLEKSIYNNHIYLIALLAFQMIFIPADQTLTVGKAKGKKVAYNWHLTVLQLQIALVYFFGGLAKVNTDWLVGLEPVSTILSQKGLNSETLSYLICYGGMLFDLLIGFLLLYKPSRIIAIAGVIIFSLTNNYLFDDINIFPFFSIAVMVLFVDWSRFKFYKKIDFVENVINKKKLKQTGILAYFLIQLILPLRHYLIPTNTDWTGEGQRFAWRMKIQTRKIIEIEYAIFDLQKKVIYPVKIERHINDYQKTQMANNPKMILDFGKYIGEQAMTKGKLNKVMVKAKVKVEFNGREAQYVVSPDLDLMSLNWTHFGKNEWINPLKEK